MTTILPTPIATHFREKGIALAQAGDSAGARQQLRQAVQHNPADEIAWFYLAALAETRAEAIAALQKVEALNPTSSHLSKARAWTNEKWPEPTTSTAEPLPPPQRSYPIAQIIGSLFLIAMLVVLTIVFVTSAATASPLQTLTNSLFPTPTNTIAQEIDRLKQRLDEAEAASDLPGQIAALQELVNLTPEDNRLSTQLAELYYEQGLVLRNGHNFEEAQIAFNHALAIQETMQTALLEREQIELYLTGVEYYQNSDWDRAIKALEKVYRRTPTYPDLDEILYSAYFNQGMTRQAANRLEVAQASFERAAAILPGVPEADQKAQEIGLLLHPPTATPLPNLPTPTPVSNDKKRVVVDISEQRAYTYLNDDLVYEFIISTGEPGRDTAIGSFEVQNKIPVAYASTWNLDMPFWLGIYYSGPLQNGFHAVPTVRSTGVTMWDGYLGQRVSYGCVILSMKDAETLYNWVDIGTPIKIQW